MPFLVLLGIIYAQYLHNPYLIVFYVALSRNLLQYNIKKKEEIVEAMPQEEPNPLMRKKKTPEELAAEAEQEELDDFTSKSKMFHLAPDPPTTTCIISMYVCLCMCTRMSLYTIYINLCI